MTPRNPDLPDGTDAKEPSTGQRPPRFWLMSGVALAVFGVALVAAATLGWLPLGNDSFVRHVPQLVGILMISQGAYWVARSRSGEDGS
ncbi:hypothetical protein AB5J72_06110 [Streptomyces sp. CG1]|uniref:hypothetical protein n=1 Tax=Streptomyces sp. CG1 TaxID=1287523 RepID=UPI0034E2332D